MQDKFSGSRCAPSVRKMKRYQFMLVLGRVFSGVRNISHTDFKLQAAKQTTGRSLQLSVSECVWNLQESSQGQSDFKQGCHERVSGSRRLQEEQQIPGLPGKNERDLRKKSGFSSVGEGFPVACKSSCDVMCHGNWQHS